MTRSAAKDTLIESMRKTNCVVCAKYMTSLTEELIDREACHDLECTECCRQFWKHRSWPYHRWTVTRMQVGPVFGVTEL